MAYISMHTLMPSLFSLSSSSSLKIQPNGIMPILRQLQATTQKRNEDALFNSLWGWWIIKDVSSATKINDEHETNHGDDV